MTATVLVLRAGFGGLKLSSRPPGRPTGTNTAPSAQQAEDKVEFGTSRHVRWFGRAGG